MTQELIARRLDGVIELDGRVDKPAWRTAEWSRRFVDMVDEAPAIYDTRAAVRWNDEHLYIAFTAEEPYLQAAQTERDSIVFLDNDLEVFIDGSDCYYELEVNAANTVYEVLFVWRDSLHTGTRFAGSEFDVHQPTAYTFGGDYDRTGASFWRGTHPRGTRWAFTGFDLPGLRTAVHLDGTLNDDTDIDRGWSLEIAIPWASLAVVAGDRPVPPQPGDVWRMFLGRFQRLVVSGQEVQPHPAMVLDSHGVYDTHQPDRWSRIRFE